MEVQAAALAMDEEEPAHEDVYEPGSGGGGFYSAGTGTTPAAAAAGEGRKRTTPVFDLGLF